MITTLVTLLWVIIYLKEWPYLGNTMQNRKFLYLKLFSILLDLNENIRVFDEVHDYRYYVKELNRSIFAWLGIYNQIYNPTYIPILG